MQAVEEDGESNGKEDGRGGGKVLQGARNHGHERPLWGTLLGSGAAGWRQGGWDGEEKYH